MECAGDKESDFGGDDFQSGNVAEQPNHRLEDAAVEEAERNDNASRPTRRIDDDGTMAATTMTQPRRLHRQRGYNHSGVHGTSSCLTDSWPRYPPSAKLMK